MHFLDFFLFPPNWRFWDSSSLLEIQRNRRKGGGRKNIYDERLYLYLRCAWTGEREIFGKGKRERTRIHLRVKNFLSLSLFFLTCLFLNTNTYGCHRLSFPFFPYFNFLTTQSSIPWVIGSNNLDTHTDQIEIFHEEEQNHPSPSTVPLLLYSTWINSTTNANLVPFRNLRFFRSHF